MDIFHVKRIIHSVYSGYVHKPIHPLMPQIVISIATNILLFTVEIVKKNIQLTFQMSQLWKEMKYIQSFYLILTLKKILKNVVSTI